MSRIGRNDPCHCGSGRKYKKCCIDVDQSWRGTNHAETSTLTMVRMNTARQTSTMTMVRMNTARQKSSPWCPGPVVVHETGAFECHGPGCEGTAFHRHEERVVQPCPAGQSELATVCRRCVDDVTVAAGGPGASVCPGFEVDHEDGSVTCTEGAACLGDDALHTQGISCSLRPGRCPVCV